MTDLSRILPDFPAARYAGLLPQIEKHQVTTADLLSLDVVDLGKRTKLPLLDLRRFCNAVLEALHADLGVSAKPQPLPPRDEAGRLRRTGADLAGRMGTISTLDEDMDRLLGGGVPVGHITDVTGESGAGKTQLLLTLLLAVQLPPPHGLGRPALYISTEAPLSTQRLAQLLRHHPRLQAVAAADRPTLDGIVSCVTPDLESQDHILQFQVPVEVARRRIGLVVLDSVAANYRAEYERGGGGGASLAARSADLIRLGQLLQDLAREHNLAVVVANQVADRFSSGPALPATPGRPLRSAPPPPSGGPAAHDSPLASRSRGLDRPPPEAEPSSSLVHVRSSMPEPPPEEAPAPPALLLDHQQRWFTGWGDDPARRAGGGADKTPSLGLVWSTQVACRLALLKRPVYGRANAVEDEDTGAATLRRWRRWLKVVFAPHVPASGPGVRGAVEYEVVMGGLRAVAKDSSKRRKGPDSGGADDP